MLPEFAASESAFFRHCNTGSHFINTLLSSCRVRYRFCISVEYEKLAGEENIDFWSDFQCSSGIFHKGAVAVKLHDFDQIVSRQDGDSEKWNHYGDDVLPMWVADSDFTVPQPVVDALASRVRHGVFGYPDDMGRALENAAVHWMFSRFSWRAEPEWVSFSPGVSAALALAITTFAAPGEGVLMFTPTYPPFIRLTKANGRTLLASSLVFEQGVYTIDWADLEAKASGAKLFLLCNPQNPTGKVFTKEELLRIGDICLRNDITVLSDEVHCDYIAPQCRHIPFASLSEELGAICLTAINPSKTFNIAGLQAAAVIAGNPELRDRFRAASGRASLWGNTLGVIAFHTAYTQCAYYADQVAAYTRKNLEQAVPFINEKIPGISTYLPEATYLLWLDCRALGMEQEELESFFIGKAKVALNSGTTFGPEGKGFMRMNLACPSACVREGLERIERAVSSL